MPFKPELFSAVSLSLSEAEKQKHIVLLGKIESYRTKSGSNNKPREEILQREIAVAPSGKRLILDPSELYQLLSQATEDCSYPIIHTQKAEYDPHHRNRFLLPHNQYQTSYPIPGRVLRVDIAIVRIYPSTDYGNFMFRYKEQAIPETEDADVKNGFYRMPRRWVEEMHMGGKPWITQAQNRLMQKP